MIKKEKKRNKPYHIVTFIVASLRLDKSSSKIDHAPAPPPPPLYPYPYPLYLWPRHMNNHTELRNVEEKIIGSCLARGEKNEDIHAHR